MTTSNQAAKSQEIYEFAVSRLPQRSCDRSPKVLRWLDFMTFSERLILRPMFEWFTSLSVCLCAFCLVMPLEVASLASSDSTESECPSEEGGKSSEDELVVSSSRRSRLDESKHSRPDFVPKTASLRSFDSYKPPTSAIVGHRLANGLSAPLLL